MDFEKTRKILWYKFRILMSGLTLLLQTRTTVFCRAGEKLFSKSKIIMNLTMQISKEITKQ